MGQGNVNFLNTSDNGMYIEKQLHIIMG